MEDHFPGRLKKILIVNPPRLFGTVFGVIKGVLPASVRDGIEIIYDMKDLQKYVSPEYLPKEYGGTGPAFNESPLEREGYAYFMNMIERAKSMEAAAKELSTQDGA